jgi:hypothetical protein
MFQLMVVGSWFFFKIIGFGSSLFVNGKPFGSKSLEYFQKL